MGANNTNKNDTGTADSQTIVLDEILDISKAAQFRSELSAYLDVQGPLTIEAENVVRIDTACLQVLTAFIKDALAREIEVKWHCPSEAICSAAGLLGLAEVLRIEIAA